MEQLLLELYQTASDGSTHSACDWALRQWNVALPAIAAEKAPTNKDWHVNTLGVTMVKIPAGSTKSFWISNREVSVAQFQRLVGKAEYCFELPLKFGAKQDLADVEAGNESRNRQYALAGAYMVQRCDYLVAVYDGQPEAGTGGTAQVLNWYRQGEIDPEYRYPDEYFEPPDKQPAFVLSPDP